MTRQTYLLTWEVTRDWVVYSAPCGRPKLPAWHDLTHLDTATTGETRTEARTHRGYQNPRCSIPYIKQHSIFLRPAHVLPYPLSHVQIICNTWYKVNTMWTVAIRYHLRTNFLEICFPAYFDPRLVGSLDTEPTDTEGRLQCVGSWAEIGTWYVYQAVCAQRTGWMNGKSYWGCLDVGVGWHTSPCTLKHCSSLTEPCEYTT